MEYAMSMLDRLHRVTDLFEEGEEVFLGQDDDGSDVVLWVNKLNSFEAQEARQDGLAFRSQRLAALADPENPEFRGVKAEMGLWGDRRLQEAWVAIRAEELYLEINDDLESEPDWRNKLEQIRRIPTLLDESGAAEDDPRRKEIDDLTIEWLEELRTRQAKRHEEALREAATHSREDLEAAYFEKWRERQTLDVFVEEKRVTEIYFALRDCSATRNGERWDHSPCNHRTRILPDRSQVRSLPEEIIAKVTDTLIKITADPRTAGNSGAPASSSASPEPSKPAEAHSTPSIPTEIPSDAPST